jgi:hypothetical protein
MEIATEFKYVTKDSERLETSIAEAGSAAMRAILQRLVQVRATVIELNQFTCDDIQTMLIEVNQCVNSNVRVNMIRMLCNLVLIILNNKDSKNYEIIKVIIFMFLLTLCPSKIFL